MATYFGEIVERSSRAFWNDDYDSDDEIDVERSEKNERKLEILHLPGSPSNVNSKLFLVVHGQLTEGFAEACLVNKGECIAEIRETQVQNGENKMSEKKSKATAAIYSLDNDIILCICDPHSDITKAFEFTEKISTWMKNSDQIIVLTCNYLSEYQVTKYQNDQDAFLRALKTNYYNSPVLCDTLEQPNTLRGIPAGILTWCQMSKKPAVAYVCFTRSFEVNSSSVKLFSELVSKLPFKLLKEKPDFRHKKYSGPEVSSNLYM